MAREDAPRYEPPDAFAASMMLRPYDPVEDAQVFGRLSRADLSDVEVTPGNAERTMAQTLDVLGARAV